MQDACDGGFTIVIRDFLRLTKYKMLIKVFIFNNKQLSMIMRKQKIRGYLRWQTDLYNCNFVEYAKNFGDL